ncbi:MAG: GIY-YIG nuclease family protein [Candidatus Omnitrophica bacterium]|nr:GIY-YIG nuclease family protein [Candidatus Omnitrophota bacterium]
MYYVYVLQSKKDGTLYIGCTNNLKERISNHKRGFNKSTKTKLPWVLIKTEVFYNNILALKREKFLKSGRGREVIKKFVLSGNGE